jgi:hypothetical protein
MPRAPGHLATVNMCNCISQSICALHVVCDSRSVAELGKTLLQTTKLIPLLKLRSPNKDKMKDIPLC